MDFSGALVGGLLSIIGYIILFAGIYKVIQIANDIREIKELIASARRNPLGSAPFASGIVPSAAPAITKDLIADDSAAAYAQSLLRVVNAESHSAQNEPHEVR